MKPFYNSYTPVLATWIMSILHTFTSCFLPYFSGETGAVWKPPGRNRWPCGKSTNEIVDMHVHGCWRHFSAQTSRSLHNVSAFIPSKLNHDVRASRLLVCFVDEKASDQFDRYPLRQQINNQYAWRYKQDATLHVHMAAKTSNKVKPKEQYIFFKFCTYNYVAQFNIYIQYAETA